MRKKLRDETDLQELIYRMEGDAQSARRVFDRGENPGKQVGMVLSTAKRIREVMKG